MSFTLNDLKDCACVSCGKGSDHAKLRRLNPSGNAYVCSSCEIRFGLKKLQAEFERQFGKAVGEKPTFRQCVRGCGRPVFLRSDGTLPSFCSVCTQELMQLKREGTEEKKKRQRSGKRTELDIIDDLFGEAGS
mgnify:CR=1 FL=1|jgi:hypothetical protein|tara:strand:+ start:9254 stop:9652 length:399 start_codon:yes stop_codon:yes gene_type:complete